MGCHICSKFTNAEVGEVFYCTNCKREDAHGAPRARIEVELNDESGVLKVMAYGSIVEEIISLSAKEIMEKTLAVDECNLMAYSKFLKSTSSFYVFVQPDKLTDNTVNRFFLVGISPINEQVDDPNLNDDGGNNDGCDGANAHTSQLLQPMPCNTGEVIVETGEVILHTTVSTTTNSKRGIFNPGSRSTKLLKPDVVAFESASASSG